MSEYQVQRKEKPSILKIAEKHLVGQAKEQLLDFVSFLKENNMSPQWGSTNSYNLSYKGRRVCIIKIAENSYQIWLNTQYNEDFNEYFQEEDDRTKDYLLSKIIYCFGCGSCKPGLDIDILGAAIEKPFMKGKRRL